jgi:hypothetical protein
MEFLTGIKNWPSFRDVFVVTIYRIILFPHIDEYVDLAAIEVFLAFRYKKKSHVPAILTNTYLTWVALPCHSRRYIHSITVPKRKERNYYVACLPFMFDLSIMSLLITTKCISRLKTLRCVM